MTWKLAGYVIERYLGRGQSGEVWQARVARSGQPVALKRMALPNAGQLAAARTEAAMLSALDHPHVIRLHDFIVTADAAVLVLDLADAGSLADLLARRSRLTAEEVVTALAPIGAAIAYAHAQGVVHADLSATNVLFSSTGLSLLADLGVARIVGDDGPTVGTPAYLDPSVALGHLPGPASDVFGLAAVAVHALRGRTLWSGSPAQMIRQATALAHGAPLDVAAELPDTPASVRAVLERALVAQPQQRCTAAEFALDLRHSLVPRPVELNAGRIQPGQPRTLKASLTSDAPSRRPDFERPAAVAVDAALPHHADGQLTYGARLATVVPARQRRQLPRPGRRPIIAVTVAVAIAAAVVLGARAPGPSGAARSPVAGLVAVTSSAGASVAPAVDGVDQALAALTRLDALRELAFATGDSSVLAQVYVAGDLLRDDAATLTRLVPTGCSLIGLRTTYRITRLVDVTPDRLTVVVSATLSPSTLICSGAPNSSVAGTSATNLQIGLTATATGFVIADERIA